MVSVVSTVLSGFTLHDTVLKRYRVAAGSARTIHDYLGGPALRSHWPGYGFQLNSRSWRAGPGAGWTASDLRDPYGTATAGYVGMMDQPRANDAHDAVRIIMYTFSLIDDYYHDKVTDYPDQPTVSITVRADDCSRLPSRRPS